MGDRITVDDVREEAIRKVQAWYRRAGIRWAYIEADRAWRVLGTIAELERGGGTRVSNYYYDAGERERRNFVQAWEEHRSEANG